MRTSVPEIVHAGVCAFVHMYVPPCLRACVRVCARLCVRAVM